MTRYCPECHDELADDLSCPTHGATLSDLPTDAELAARFATFGDPVDPADVPALVRAGVEVWSYGYDADDPELFTTLDTSDLWAFEGREADPAVVESWAPFRADQDATR